MSHIETAEPQHQAIVVPILLTSEDEVVKSANSPQACWFREHLAHTLNAKLLSFEASRQLIHNEPLRDALRSIDRPCVFLVYFSQHGPLTQLNSPEFKFININAAAFPIFFFHQTATGDSPLLVKLEETYLLNYGRAFRLYDLMAFTPWQQNECRQYLQEQVALSTDLHAAYHARHDPFILDSSGDMIRLPWLRIFKEELSISLFYACIEYILMINHLFTLILFRIGQYRVANSPELISLDRPKMTSLEDELFQPKTALSDGRLNQIMKKIHVYLKDDNPFARMLRIDVPDPLASSFRQILEDLDIKLSLPRRMAWAHVIEAVISIRNATKGHGVTYFIENAINRTIVEVVVEMTSSIHSLDYEMVWHRENERLDMDFNTFVYFKSLDSEYADRIINSEVSLIFDDSSVSMRHLLSYNPFYDFFLFEGYSANGEESYHKNYTTGIYI